MPPFLPGFAIFAMMEVDALAWSEGFEMCDTDEIIERALAKYRHCNSYLDRGCIRTNRVNSEIETRFETYFLRPAYLRSEWQQYNGSKAIGSKGGFWSDGEIARIRLKTGMQTCAPRDVLSINSVEISRFLLPSYRLSFSPNSVPLLGAVLIAEEELESGECYVLECNEDRIWTRRYWVLKSNFAIVQAEVLYIRNGAEIARSERELAQRERKMAALLNRPAIDLPEPENLEDEILLTKYEFYDVIFDAPLVETVFEFPVA